MHELFLTLFLLVGGALLGLSVPLIQRRVRPNPWYGFRVRRTLEDPKIWYLVNAFAAWRMLWVGVATILTAIAFYFAPGIPLPVYASIVGAVVLLGTMIALVQSFAYLQQLVKRKIRD